jgi:AcrR family transcriptional regulator
LTRALIDLVVEKRYDAVTIQDLLDRADVGRSTFYAHYRGKDDLLLRSFERMIAMLDEHMERNGPAHRVAPVRELFAHVSDFRKFHQSLSRSRVLDRQHEARVDCVSRIIERRLAARQGSSPAAVPLPVKARALAGALLALLTWWLDRGQSLTPQQMETLFHAMWK